MFQLVPQHLLPSLYPSKRKKDNGRNQQKKKNTVLKGPGKEFRLISILNGQGVEEGRHAYLIIAETGKQTIKGKERH